VQSNRLAFTYLDAVLPCVPNDARRDVKAHRLRIEKLRAKRVGMMAFHPAARIGDQRETGCVASDLLGRGAMVAIPPTPWPAVSAVH
jgi:hypothetical protein